MYNVHLTHSLLCFEFVEFTLGYDASNIVDSNKAHSQLFTIKYYLVSCSQLLLHAINATKPIGTV